MEFIKKAGKFAKNVQERTGEAVETTKLYAKITSEKNTIADLTRQLGVLCLEKYDAGANYDADLTAVYEKVCRSREIIEEFRAEIAAIKDARAAQDEAEEAAEAAKAAEAAEAAPAADETAEAEPAADEPAEEAPAVPKVHCSNCGMPHDEGVRFCSHCGVKLVP